LRRAGQRKKAVQYLLGNPLSAIQMTQHDVRAGLYAPLRLLIYEDEEGKTCVEYDKPSSLLGQFGNANVTEVAVMIDRSWSSCWPMRCSDLARQGSNHWRAGDQTTAEGVDMRKLEGRIALITGGNSGIGLATARQFVKEGAYVYITGRRERELTAAVREIGGDVTGIQGDVSNLSDLDRLFALIKREKGRLDIVFANAGAAKYAALGEITEDLYHQIFDINVKGVLFTVQKVLPLLPDGASIILNASIVASKGLASNSVYSASKAAVRSFARTWTSDLKPRRIRVNAVSPGSTDTPGLSNLLASSEVGAQRRQLISSAVPLGRLGTPDEIARAVVFLASDDASYITGAELFVDGGLAQV
jgi:NAD(P)-dependent dehydrogenase (short-subunit alcohol dehydrogenase family)